MLKKLFVMAVALFAVTTASASVADTVPFPSDKIDNLALSRDELVEIYRSAAQWPWGAKEGLWRAAQGGRTGSSWIKCPGKSGVEERMSFGETAVETRSWASTSDIGGASLPVIAVAVYPDARAAADVFACDIGDMRQDRAYFSTVTGPDFIRWRDEFPPSSPSAPPESIDTGAARVIGNVIVEAKVRDGKATTEWESPGSLASALVDRVGLHVRQG